MATSLNGSEDRKLIRSVLEKIRCATQTNLGRYVFQWRKADSLQLSFQGYFRLVGTVGSLG